METAADIITGILLMGGSLFAVVGGIGLLRLPDFFSRMHAGGMTDTMGATLILTGLMFQAGFSLVTFKLVLITLLLLLSSPTSAHALAKSALRQGLKPLTTRKEERP
jgi:multicomponent Na+:H+ antiporter subunit G